VKSFINIILTASIKLFIAFKLDLDLHVFHFYLLKCILILSYLVFIPNYIFLLFFVYSQLENIRSGIMSYNIKIRLAFKTGTTLALFIKTIMKHLLIKRGIFIGCRFAMQSSRNFIIKPFQNVLFPSVLVSPVNTKHPL